MSKTYEKWAGEVDVAVSIGRDGVAETFQGEGALYEAIDAYGRQAFHAGQASVSPEAAASTKAQREVERLTAGLTDIIREGAFTDKTRNFQARLSKLLAEAP